MQPIGYPPEETSATALSAGKSNLGCAHRRDAFIAGPSGSLPRVMKDNSLPHPALITSGIALHGNTQSLRNGAGAEQRTTDLLHTQCQLLEHTWVHHERDECLFHRWGFPGGQMDERDKSCLRRNKHPKPCQLLVIQQPQASAAHLVFWKLQWEHHALSLFSKHP